MRRSVSFRRQFWPELPEGKARSRSLDIDMPVAKRGQAEALLVAGIGSVADRDHVLSRSQTIALAQRRQGLAKGRRLEYFTASRQADQRGW
jgi:hypothetical protein